MDHQIMTVLGWILSPICAALITAAITTRRHATEREEAIEQGLRALLRQQIIDLHKKYVVDARPCPVRIKEQATAIHDAYQKLGGNGTGTQLWEEIMEAHIE
jgi:hypothetical protein